MTAQFQDGLHQDGLPQDGLPTPRRTWALISISLGTILVVLDNGMLNVALPAIARDLAIPPAQAIWLVSAYQLGLIAALLTAASLGEILCY